MYKVNFLYGEFLKSIYILAIRQAIPRNKTNSAAKFTVNFVILVNSQANKIPNFHVVNFVNRNLNMLGINYILEF